MTAEPSWRKPAGIFVILVLIVDLGGTRRSAGGLRRNLAWLVQALYYLVAGIVWILPLKPLLRWMETGRFRAG